MKTEKSVLSFPLRFSEETKEAVRIAAFKNKRSMNMEINARLEDSLDKEGWIDKAKESLSEAS